jgi:hypothetical protein
MTSVGIRDILADPYLWLLDPDPFPDPFLDPTTVLLISRMPKKYFFSLIFSYNLHPVTLSSDLKIKFFAKKILS